MPDVYELEFSDQALTTYTEWSPKIKADTELKIYHGRGRREI